MKENYHKHTVEDFAQDTFFQKWVNKPDAECEEFWSEWMGKNPARIFDVNEAAEMVRSLRFVEKDIDESKVESLWGHISKDIKQETRNGQLTGTKKPVSFFLKIAAALIPLCIIGYMYLQDGQLFDQAETVEAVSIIKDNPNGKKSQFLLPDGTRVFLNANSQLAYGSLFNDEIIRKVHLTGEAFFMVKKDSLRPFIIESGDLQVQVLGTSFNVRAFQDEEKITVAVEEGKVRLQNKTNADDGESIVLYHHDMGIFEKASQELSKEKVIGNEVFDWRNGIMHFRQADFKKIQKTLEQWYGVSFVINGKIDSRKDFTGSYANKPLSTVLDGLKFVYEFEYQIDDKTITIN